MQIKRFVLIVPFLLFAFSANAVTLRLPETGYSATRIVNASGTEISGTLYAQDGKERWETMANGMQSIAILLPRQSRLLVYMPQMNMAMEMDAESAAERGLRPMPEEVEAVEEGRETIEGEETTRYRILPQDSNLDDVRAWVTSDGIPVKITGRSPQGEFSMRLTDLRRGEQDASLFRLPDGVAPMKMPMGMPGMAGGIPGMPF